MLTLLAGIVVLAAPFASIITLALVVGVWLVIIGVVEVVTAFGIREASKELEHSAIPPSYYTLS